jgi:hypothetical protein
MDRWHEFADCKTRKDAGGEVVVADAMSELEVLVKHGAKGERDRLVFC